MAAVAELQAGVMSPRELAARLDETLATSVIPEPWEASDEMGVEWWTVRYPDSSVIAGFVGVGTIHIERADSAWRVYWTIACPDAPGADERRAWLRAAIRAFAGSSAVVVDGARVVRERGQA